MPSFSDFAENELLDAATGVGTYVTTTPHLSLHTAIPTETGGSEVSGGSYARQPTVFNIAAAGQESL